MGSDNEDPAPPTTTTTWYTGRVIGVPSGDSLRLAALKQSLEKVVSLSSIRAPKLAAIVGCAEEPYAWESREFLRKLLIGEDVIFRIDYISTKNREFCSVFLQNINVACLLVCFGMAKVKQQIQVSPNLDQLHRLQIEARRKRLGQWSEQPPTSTRDCTSSKLSSVDLLAQRKGRPCKAIIEHVKDGSTIKAYLLPDFQSIHMNVAGVQAPCSGRMEWPGMVNIGLWEGESSGSSSTSLTRAQKHAAVMPPPPEMTSEKFGKKARYFTETRILHRDVCIILEGVDTSSNLVGSVYYYEGNASRSLAMELLTNGLARYVDSSACFLDEDVRRQLKAAEIKAKKDGIKIWKNFVPPFTCTKPIHGQEFTGTVVEVVSGDFIVVVDDAAPYGCPSAERRVHLSSLKCPKIGSHRRDESPAPYALVAKEFLRSHLIGRKVYVSMEFTRKINLADEEDSRMMDFGSVFLCPSEGSVINIPGSSKFQLLGSNVAEMVIAEGLGVAVKHMDFDERSHYYETLVKAEEKAVEAKKGVHSRMDPPVVNDTDLVNPTANEAKVFFPYLRGNRGRAAVVEHIFSGHRFKLRLPGDGCTIAFSFSGVRSPGRGERFSDEAIALMRRRIMQKDVEVTVHAVDNKGTFLGAIWEGKTNMAVVLLEAGLARIQASLHESMIDDRLIQAEKSAKHRKLKIWENYIEFRESSNVLRRTKEVKKVLVTEVMGGGKFYIQEVGDHRVASIMEKMASLSLEKPAFGSFLPRKGEVVSAQFSADSTWNRAMIVEVPQRLESPRDKYEVFYIDYGNQETVPYYSLRPLDESLASAPGAAQLCSLAYVKVPHIDDDYGEEAAAYFSDLALGNGKVFSARVEGRVGRGDGAEKRGQGSGASMLMVTLVDEECGTAINAAMLEAGLAWMERRRKWDSQEKKVRQEEWKRYEGEAKARRLNIWECGDFDWDDEHSSRPYGRG